VNQKDAGRQAGVGSDATWLAKDNLVERLGVLGFPRGEDVRQGWATFERFPDGFGKDGQDRIEAINVSEQGEAYAVASHRSQSEGLPHYDETSSVVLANHLERLDLWLQRDRDYAPGYVESAEATAKAAGLRLAAKDVRDASESLGVATVLSAVDQAAAQQLFGMVPKFVGVTSWRCGANFAVSDDREALTAEVLRLLDQGHENPIIGTPKDGFFLRILADKEAGADFSNKLSPLDGFADLIEEFPEPTGKVVVLEAMSGGWDTYTQGGEVTQSTPDTPERLGPYTAEEAKRARDCMNLDCIPKEELEWFAHKFVGSSNNPEAAARILFPEEDLFSAAAVTHRLYVYACKKITARTFREEGYITSAVADENTCDRIYNDLPDYAKW